MERFYERRAPNPGSLRNIRGDAGSLYRFLPKRDWETWRRAESEGPKPPRKGLYNPKRPVAMSKTEVQEYRRRWEITVEGDTVPKPVTSLDGFLFSKYDHVKLELVKAGFAEASPIQAQCWPMAMMGRDLIVIAEKGSASGKTLAYLLPALQHISDQGQQALQALVLTPTRELALQIQLEATKYGARPKKNSACIYKGLPKSQAVAELEKGVEMIIATPESLIDMLDSEPNIINLRFVTYLVVDDADRMLDMGFESHIQKIYDRVHPDRQTSYWSATWSKDLEQLAQRTLINPFRTIIGSPDLKANHAIRQHVYVVSKDEKYKKLVELLEDMKFGCRILIFMDTLVSCLQISYELGLNYVHNYWPQIIIREDMYQDDRELVLSGSSPAKSWLMIATDVSIRHLDVKDVNYVINYDFPESLEDYLRRIRIAGSVKGAAYTLFTAADARFSEGLVNILEEAGQKVNPMLVSMGRDAPSPMDEDKPKVSMGRDVFAPSSEKKPKVSRGHDAVSPSSNSDKQKPMVSSMGSDAFAPSSSSDEQKPMVSMGRDALVMRRNPIERNLRYLWDVMHLRL